MSSNNDQVHRFIFDNAGIRGEIISLNKAYLEACQHQELPPTVKSLLGEFLAAVGLLGEILKFDGTITLQARGDALVPLIMAEINHQGQLRGIAKVSPGLAEQDLHNLPTKELIGDGVLSLTMDPLKGNRYQGIIELSSENLADSLTQYFCQSEQLPTQVWLYASENHAGGLMLQALPEETTQRYDSEQWQTAKQLASTITPEELFGLDHANTLTRLFSEEYVVRIFDPKGLRFKCHCSRERCSKTLRTLGEQEAMDILKTNPSIDINCEFCGQDYRFTKDDVNTLFSQDSTESPNSNTLH